MLFKRRDHDDETQFIGEARVVDPSEDITEMRDSTIDAVAEAQIVTAVAVIGPTIVIKGEVTGDEDLLVEGRVEGTVALPKSRLTVGASGEIAANVSAKTVNIEGSIIGDVAAIENVVLRSSGKMQGNIKAPRITLEEGCKFNGTVNMEMEPTAVVTDLKKSTQEPTIKKTTEQHAV
jgi:cytoskeletal protein CcmA (bactofilin family)